MCQHLMGDPMNYQSNYFFGFPRFPRKTDHSEIKSEDFIRNLHRNISQIENFLEKIEHQ